jgi:AmiR/NasT family two-component response regulator
VDEEDERRQALQDGAAGYVVKPAETARFLAVVTRSVNRWMRRRDATGRVLCPADREDVGND